MGTRPSRRRLMRAMAMVVSLAGMAGCRSVVSAGQSSWDWIAVKTRTIRPSSPASAPAEIAAVGATNDPASQAASQPEPRPNWVKRLHIPQMSEIASMPEPLTSEQGAAPRKRLPPVVAPPPKPDLLSPPKLNTSTVIHDEDSGPTLSLTARPGGKSR